ncbi:MAG TPA: tetratricopeptide repeat protein, partial [Candidatus Krumholzibacterium sp.]|nr:tetratricopeptide repeat protein [Candidatus Krumholzibacterium sp.]
DRALEIDPEEVEVRLASGTYYYMGEVDLDRALEEFRAAERLGGLRDPVYYWLGRTHRKRGELDEAIRYMTKHVQYNPLSNGGWRQLAETYMMLHRFAEAERCFDRAIALNPSVAVDYQWKGWLYLIWNGDKERARRAIDEQAIVLGLHAPTGGVDILGRAKYRILREYYEQDVLEGEGYDPMLKGLAFELVGDVERSRAYYDSARAIWEPRVAEFPENFPYHFILAFVYAELGREAEAIREAETALRLTENVFLNRDHVVANAAEVFLLVGEHERALDLIEIALSNPGSYITPMELRIDPVWDPIRDHPRFQALLEEYE